MTAVGGPVDVVVIGAGISGLAAAYKLQRAAPALRLAVIEQEAGPAQHQSGRNSGVLHAGLAYVPGSLKARLAVDGIRQMAEFCHEHDVPHRACGKVVVATRPAELPALHTLMERGRQNGLRDLRWLDQAELRELEPNVAGVAALHVPEEGIVDFRVVCRRLADLVTTNGGQICYGAPVRRLRREGHWWKVDTDAGACAARFLLNCAGLQADRIAALAGQPPHVRIVPFRGSYYTLRPERSGLVRHLVYPVPDPAFPFLGVHFTRDVHGEVHVGPNASLAFARQRYTTRAVDLKDTAAALGYRGFWQFCARHPGRCVDELVQSLSRARFARAARRLVPDLRTDDLLPGRAGIRAQAMRPNGELVMDFLLADGPDAVHLLNVPSPGATAALAVADEVARRIIGRLGVLCPLRVSPAWSAAPEARS